MAKKFRFAKPGEALHSFEGINELKETYEGRRSDGSRRSSIQPDYSEASTDKYEALQVRVS